MELCLPSVELVSTCGDSLGLIESAGRTCYKSEEKITPNSKFDFVEKIIKSGHESVLEHATATFRIICDRGVTHELVRHRIASYSQESTRYCNYSEKGLKFIIPSWLEDKLRPGYYPDHWGEGVLISSNVDCWLAAVLYAGEQYCILLENGWTPQQARGVLPNSLKTEIVVTMNFRSLRNFFKLRCSLSAHPDMQKVACLMYNEITAMIPIVFDQCWGY